MRFMRFSQEKKYYNLLFVLAKGSRDTELQRLQLEDQNISYINWFSRHFIDSKI